MPGGIRPVPALCDKKIRVSPTPLSVKGENADENPIYRPAVSLAGTRPKRAALHGRRVWRKQAGSESPPALHSRLSSVLTAGDGKAICLSFRGYQLSGV